MSKCKIIFNVIIILLGIAWCFQYYRLNDGKLITCDYPEKRYYTEEEVYYGDNIVYGKDDRSPGYSITFLDKRIVDCKDYLNEIGKTENDFQISMPEKILEVTVKISNIENTDSTQGVDFYPLWLIGDDWYQTYSSEFTAYANEIYNDDPAQAFGIQVKKGKSYEIKIVYPMLRIQFASHTWNNLDKESMSLTVTCRPKRQLICIQ